MSDDMGKTVYANALLKDGQIMFWWTGLDPCKYPESFYKDFYFAGLHMMEELATGRYALVVKEMTAKDNAGFDEAVEFYRQYKIHPDSSGAPPYNENSK